MHPEPAPADPASAWMNHLERAHDRAHAAARAIEEYMEPSEHLETAARRLECGLAAMYDAFDGRADRITAIGVAHGRLWEAAILVARAGLSNALAALREACGELVGAEERFPLVPVAGRAAAELRAGADLPPLHSIERASLAPSFRAPPVPEIEIDELDEEEPKTQVREPTTFEELAQAAEAVRRLAQEQTEAIERRSKARAERKKAEGKKAEGAQGVVPPGFAFVPPAALDEGAFVRRWARECFEDIGMLGMQRTPLAGDDWRACLALERRLVNAVDALAALGPDAVAYVEALAMDAPVANPMSVFAIAMIGGCLEGRDALAGAERVLYRFGPNDPVVAAPFVSAMKLGPNPFVRGAMRSLFASTELGCRAIGVEVMGYRGWLGREELAALADEEDTRVFALALPVLATTRHRDFGRAVGRALEHEDLGVQAAALDAMAIGAHPKAAAAARAAAQGALGEHALVRLAIVGDEGDAQWLLERMQRSPTVEAVEAVGWAGLVEAVPALLRVLETGEKDEVKRAGGAALERMLGANLIESIEILPEALEEVEVVDPDPEPPRSRAALAVLVSQPRDLPSAGSSETLEVPSADPAKWRAYWGGRGRRVDPRLRWRRGQAYLPSVSLYELDRLALSTEDRRRLHCELAARMGKITPFDPHDFVLMQEKSLKAWGALVQGSGGTPGSWGLAGRR